MEQTTPPRSFTGCAYMVATDDRQVAAAVPLRLRLNHEGRWQFALISDDGNEMVFDAREGTLRCDRIQLAMEPPSPAAE